ncbi:diacylglycerol kinase [Helicobacter winghamensis]|uniref:Diacylglycerol kinase n=1 Tax=Helicobacter winghamensis TaxID=157268 RepID=A0A2N3PHQ6_9HELI|nr:diacylglycerol kinase [Helicobacter winghamensis]EEO25540.1 prokaryotic diacylglycerol kinase [Helicobacter winghamensis ATCC BAA-430]PKT78041.1 diacylglycerol kinase [Helicobacter winghamensis]PKT78306.1 diacylglycerol kinase [Helicobacter winghamensis]PKT78569.1 diacylglycerol kinase [Helicobacter winghamensis]PKT80102.1 diacylglycerol kinase [Helicobacter winghamensis]
MKPKYHFFKNTQYALEGIKALLKHEISFRIEFSIIIPCAILSFFLPIGVVEQILLIGVLFLILITEALNSSIEACVDLVTTKWHKQAKIAKDCASAAVFFSITLALIVWFVVLLQFLIPTF